MSLMMEFGCRFFLLLTVLSFAFRGEALAGTCGDYLQTSHLASPEELKLTAELPADPSAPCNGPSCSHGEPRPAPISPPVIQHGQDQESIPQLTITRDHDLFRSTQPEFDFATYSFEFGGRVFHPPRIV